ncbi:SRPBCC family protein [Streptomyces armeniacus]|uniref:SRPBCC family protein n=1 Tax=Streptomyces armeniacus TaxID=83291 RepID=UPI001AD7FBFB|nr:SRPBCC family protein [Streptomyces armeniacus]
MTKAWHQYRFHNVWLLPAPPSAVYAELARAADYPAWWPQVREVRAVDEGSGTARFRSYLPYDLEVTARAVRQDPEAGVLEIAMSGDLVGWARWTITSVSGMGGGRRVRGMRGGPYGAEGGGTRAEFDQWVEARKPLLRLFALPCRPLFTANHALMMRAGCRGLRKRLRRGLDEA